jgi:hypothetical protein
VNTQHLDVLDHVGVGFAPFDNAFFKHYQIFFEEDNVRRFFCGANEVRESTGSVNRNADIGRLYRRRVVDAVSHVADRMPVAA